jgi:dTDP-glucose 4,6-dehydratase
MRLLVTGGAGFIGSNFVRHRLTTYPTDYVLVVDKLTYAGDPRSLDDVANARGARYSFVRADIADADIMQETLAEFSPDVIVNFAAESHNSRGIIDPGAFVRTNVLGTQILLEAARRVGVSRFHHISTCEVYGDLALDSTDSFNEESAYQPRTPYNASKASADMIVGAYHRTFGLPTTTTVCANNYGPFQYPEKVIPLFATNALDDRPLPLYRQSANRREWLHVLDHCSAIDAVLSHGRVGETYNVGSGDERSIEEIADAVLDILGKPASLKTYVDDRPGHDRRYLLDHKKISRELRWQPRITFEAGLRETLTWYANNRAWWEPKRDALARDLNEFAWQTKKASAETVG